MMVGLLLLTLLGLFAGLYQDFWRPLFSGAPPVVNASDDEPSVAERLLNERVAQAQTQYGEYSTAFSSAVHTFADEHLEDIFAECIAQVSSRDPSLPFMLAALRAIPPGDVTQSEALRDQVAKAVLPHRQQVETVIFERFNTRLMDDLRELTSASVYSPWMTRVLLEWTNRKNDDSWLVQECIASLLGDPERLGSWLYAYVRRDSEPASWDGDSREVTNMRFDLLRTLERLLGNALNDGRQEVIARVRLNFPSSTAVPSPPQSGR